MSKKYRYEQLKPGTIEIGSTVYAEFRGEYYPVEVLEWHSSTHDHVWCKWPYELIAQLDSCSRYGLGFVNDLYRRIEVEERKPRRFTVTNDKFCFSFEGVEDVGLGETVKLREVIPPEVKELPDSEGVWIERQTMRFPADIELINGSLQRWTVTSGNGYHLEPLKGEWIKLDDLIKQAWEDVQ